MADAPNPNQLFSPGTGGQMNTQGGLINAPQYGGKYSSIHIMKYVAIAKSYIAIREFLWASSPYKGLHVLVVDSRLT